MRKEESVLPGLPLQTTYEAANDRSESFDSRSRTRSLNSADRPPPFRGPAKAPSDTTENQKENDQSKRLLLLILRRRSQEKNFIGPLPRVRKLMGGLEFIYPN